MPYSVYRDGQWWDVVVSRTKLPTPLIPVWCCHDDTRRLLCQVAKSERFGWPVVVAGDVVIGPRLVEGFKTRWQAIEYAIKIRPEWNPREED